jgi:hypothetical protein
MGGRRRGRTASDNVQIGPESNGLGDLGGLPPQRRQHSVKGPAAMPQVSAQIAQVAAVAFGVDHEHGGGATTRWMLLWVVNRWRAPVVPLGPVFCQGD